LWSQELGTQVPPNEGYTCNDDGRQRELRLGPVLEVVWTEQDANTKDQALEKQQKTCDDRDGDDGPATGGEAHAKYKQPEGDDVRQG
jgi:hypothetical protein